MIILHDTDILKQKERSLGICKGKITYQLNEISSSALQLSLNGTITFPGLINSHDHLDYNLLPQLDTGECNNYVDWARELASRWQTEIDAIRKVPEELSTQWGLYKNLLNGITHVVNHNETIDIKDPLINIFRKCYSLHSVVMQRRWKYTLNNPFNFKWPYVFHIGEGIDTWSSRDIDTLIKWNHLKKTLIGVHGVAMNEFQAQKFKALIWCPASNFFMFKKTAQIKLLKKKTKILFGTDSTLTAHWSIWDHLRMALNTDMADREEIINMLSSNAAEVWGLRNYGMKEGNEADIVVAKKKSGNPMHAFFEISPADIVLVICNGQIKLFDACILPQLKAQHYNELEKFTCVSVNGCNKYVYGNLPALANEIRSHCPSVSFPFT